MIASCVCVCNYACGGSSLVTTDHAALVGATQPCLMRLLLLVITGDSVILSPVNEQSMVAS